MTNKYIVAMDSFKGSLSSLDAGMAVTDALKGADGGADVTVIPVSDGGEGMLDTFMTFASWRKISVDVHDLMMRPCRAEYIVLPDGTAVIETARVVGLSLVEESLRNPLVATSYGVGEMMAHAVRSGCCRMVIGLGGSGVSDAGIGMIRALIDIFAPHATADALLDGELGQCRITVASDVTSPLCGPDGAARMFGGQKGADAAMIEKLEGRAARFASLSARHFGYDRSSEPGAGAAGGLGYALMQYLGAEMRSGADIVLDMAGFDRLIADATCVVTGEGHADRQTLEGKLPARVLGRARVLGVPVWLVAGGVDDAPYLSNAGFTRIASVSPEDMPLCQAMLPDVARANIRLTVHKMMNNADI